MFYSQDILQKRGGKFGIIWIAATRAIQLSKREYSSVNLRRICEDIIKFITLKAAADGSGVRPRFSLYLSSQLMFGVCRVYRKQQEYLFTDTTQLSMRFMTSQSTANIDLQVKKMDDMTIPDDMEGPRRDSTTLGFGTLHEYSDAHIDQIPDIEFWTYEEGLYDSASPPAMEVYRLPEKSKSTRRARPDLPEPVVSPPAFTAEVGPMQAPNASISLKDDTMGHQRTPDILIPGEQDLPPADLTMEHLSAVENMSSLLGADPFEIPPAATDPITVDIPQDGHVGDLRAPPTEDGHVGDLRAPPTVEGQGSATLSDEEKMLSPNEETPAVFIDPALLDLDGRPQRLPPPSPGVTPIQQQPTDRQAARQALRDNLSMNLSPIDVERDTPRTRRNKRRLLFADVDIQIPQKQLRYQITNGAETSAQMELPITERYRVQDLFNRPFSRAIQRNHRLLALWRRNTKTRPITEPSDSDQEYPIWTVPGLGAESSSSGSDHDSPRQRVLEPPNIPTVEQQPEELLYMEDQPELAPIPEEGVSMEALREASVSHIEVGRDASLRDLSSSGLLGDMMTPHMSLLSRSLQDTSHSLSTTGEISMQTDSARKSTGSRKRAATASFEDDPREETTLGHGEQFILQDIPEDQEIQQADISLDLLASPILAPPTKLPRMQDGQETSPTPEGADSAPAAKTASPLPHHKIMRSVKTFTKKTKFVTFLEVCPITQTRDRAAILFSALLDLCALHRLAVEQEAPFDPIYICRGSRW